MSEADTLLEVVALDPNAGTVWPGALFHGDSLKSGRLTPINVSRAPGSITVINLTKTGTGSTLFTQAMSDPSLPASQDVIQTLTSDPRNLAKEQPADITLAITQVHSFEQAMLDAGVSASWLTGSASASLRSAATQKHNGLIVNFVQRYYSLRFGDPTSVTSFFAPSVTLDDVRAVTHPPDAGLSSDPMMYISEVKFGRMALIAISSDEDSSSLEAAVKASISVGLSGGSISLDSTSRSILQNSEIEGLVIGGSSTSGAQLLSSIAGGNIDGLTKFIEDGATYDPNSSPGAPISYTARYLDNTVADSSFTADFSDTGCSDAEVPITRGRVAFQVGNDDKDDEMYPFLTITQNGQVLADVSGLGWDSAGQGGTWDDHTYHGPFSFPINGLTLSNCSSLQATVGQRSTRGTNPGWRTTLEIDVLVGDHWDTVKAMSGNQDEFIWGDNHSGQDTIGLSCPQS